MIGVACTSCDLYWSWILFAVYYNSANLEYSLHWNGGKKKKWNKQKEWEKSYGIRYKYVYAYVENNNICLEFRFVADMSSWNFESKRPQYVAYFFLILVQMCSRFHHTIKRNGDGEIRCHCPHMQKKKLSYQKISCCRNGTVRLNIQ